MTPTGKTQSQICLQGHRCRKTGRTKPRSPCFLQNTLTAVSLKSCPLHWPLLTDDLYRCPASLGACDGEASQGIFEGPRTYDHAYHFANGTLVVSDRRLLVVVLISCVVQWIVLPTYWGSLGEPQSHIPNLTGYLVNYDGDGALGQAMIQAFQNNTAGIGVTPPNAHLTWYIVDSATVPTENDVIQHVLEEKIWTAVVSKSHFVCLCAEWSKACHHGVLISPPCLYQSTPVRLKHSSMPGTTETTRIAPLSR